MTTIEQLPPMRDPIAEPGDTRPDESTSAPLSNPLESLLARAYTLNWEAIFYVGLFIVTVLTRFVNLGDRVMSHDESLHVKYSYDLSTTGNFQHTPLMHGPVLFHATALMYLMFGDSDYSARLYPAILGTILVFFPKLLFQRWLGKFGALIGCVLLLISPMVLFHNRYIREDTPSIFFTLIMVYAIFAYIDGIQPRRIRWLIVMGAAMLLSLASKEVAFMYIGIFGLGVALFWLFQVVQGLRSGATAPIVGWVIGGAIGLAVIAIGSLVLGTSLGNVLNAAGVAISPRVTILIAAGVLALFALILFGPIRHILGNIGDEGNSYFKLLMAGLILGTVAALGGTVILNIISPSAAAEDTTFALLHRQLAWIVLLAVPLILIVVSTAIARFSDSSLLGVIVGLALAGIGLLFVVNIPLASRLLLFPALLGTMWLLSGFVRPANGERLPWGDIVIALTLVLAVGLFSLVFGMGEVSMTVRLLLTAGIVVAEAVIMWAVTMSLRGTGLVRVPWREVAMVLLIAAITCIVFVYLEERSRNVPNVSGESKSATATYNDNWILLAWVVGLIVSGGIVALRLLTSFFQEMRRYPAFDVLIVVATLGLPWIAAIPIFLAGYPLDGSYVNQDVIRASVLGSIPFWLISVTAGLSWNPGAWLACAGTFYSIFAFFYTTIFTNVNGIATGLIGSLGYWLAQQGVRRGGQPQYYYLLVQLPIYEYLPVIGSFVAGIVGMSGLWRFRRDRIVESAALAQASLAEANPDQYGVEGMDLSESLDVNSEPALGEQAIEATAAQINVADLNIPPIDAMGGATFDPAPDVPAADYAGSTFAEVDPNADPDNLPNLVEDEDQPKEKPKHHPIIEPEQLTRLPFLPFVGLWAVLIILAFTMAGEKMPWLTTHLTVPLGFLTAWYLGTQLEKVNWRSFTKLGWALIFLTPIMAIALANVVGPFIFGNSPFSSLDRDSLLKTFTWVGALILAGLVGYAIAQIWRRIGIQGAARITLLGVFLLLAILTARTAWMAAFINYDSAREFMVYAHGAPADKTIMQQIDEISQRTTEGKDIKVAYDNGISWPGTWYFRNYPNARYLGENPESATDLDTFTAIVISDNNNSKVEAKLADKFYKTKLIRLWWPMQDYFDLNKDRIDNIFAGAKDDSTPANWAPPAQLRQGLWDIWWNRDYTAYGKAVNKTFDVSQWPVADWMYFYVRKDVAAQVWDFGTGAVKVAGLPEDPFNKLRCDACQPMLTFTGNDTQGTPLNHPRDIAVGPNGNLYVADAQNARVVIFDTNGKFLRGFGTGGSVDNGPTGAPGGTFREPWGIAVGADGKIYVADTWNHRIQVFDGDGVFLQQWGKFEQAASGTAGDMQGMWGPRDVAVDSLNNVYVADTGNKRIRVYDQDGTLKFDIGQSLLNEPVGLAINNETRELYVADTWNKKIQVFGLDGAPVRAWDVSAWGQTPESGNRPYLALDKSGTHLFVTDPDSGRVIVFTTDGKPVLTFAQQGILSGIVIDQNGRLFVTDSEHGSVLEYLESSLPNIAPPPALQPIKPVLPATEPVAGPVF